MKWAIPKGGEKRVVRKFAWVPTKVDTTAIWLEHYYAVQRYYDSPSNDWWIYGGWIEVKKMLSYDEKEDTKVS